MRALVGIVVLLAMPAAAHDGDDALSAWYRSLVSNDGKSCCSMRDCMPAEARLRNGGWEILMATASGSVRWFAVPPEAVLRRENADGRPILCRVGDVIRCFVPPSGA